jgi:hypothetical protein
MKVYISARFDRLDEMRDHAAKIAAAGHQVVCRWLRDDHQPAPTPHLPPGTGLHPDDPNDSWAADDIADVRSCDVLVAFTEPPMVGPMRGGRHVELGAALTLGKRIIVVPFRENVFCWLPQVEQCDGIEHVIAMLNCWSASDPAESVILEAKNIITGARRNSYGNPEDSFAVIASLWTTYLRRASRRPDARAVTPTDVAVMMALLKIARLAETPTHHDSTVDLIGYGACLARCQAQVQP